MYLYTYDSVFFLNEIIKRYKRIKSNDDIFKLAILFYVSLKHVVISITSYGLPKP